jgi:aspartate/methionine/tyrosine aminotransferase
MSAPETLQRLSSRARQIAPFYAVEVYRRALALAENGRAILMCIGEPDFPTPERVVRAAAAAAAAGETHYTTPLGIPPLRRAIARRYADHYGVEVDPSRIIVTVGASGALTLAFGAIAEPGDEILMADPGYPSNRAGLAFCGARAGLVPVGPDERFQLTPELVEAHWGPDTRGVMIATPSNPTGTTISPETLRGIHDIVRNRGGVLLVDEIYHGLTYGHRPPTALANGDDVFVVNSFSKYFCMTGWRLGWLVAPEAYLPALERMQAHLYICAPSVSQWAGIAALEPESLATFEEQRVELQRRRDYLVPALDQIGLHVACEPDGAFYTYANVSAFAKDSWDFAIRLLEDTGVAVTPGRDFGMHRANEFVRISFTASLPQLEEGVRAIRRFVQAD